MKSMKTNSRDMINLALVVVLTVSVAIVAIAINTTDRILGFLNFYSKVAALQLYANLVLLYLAIEDTIPVEARPRLCEYLCRANYGLAMGNFEIDMNDGEVVFRISADVEGVGLTETTVGNMFEEAALTMDRFYPGLVKVAYEGIEPVDAIPAPDDPASPDEEDS